MLTGWKSKVEERLERLHGTAILLARHVVCLPYIFRLLFIHTGADNWYVPIIGDLRYSMIKQLAMEK